MSNCDTFSTTH